MFKALILDDSSAIHAELMAQAVTEGDGSIRASIDLERVAGAAPREIAESPDGELDQVAPVVAVAVLGQRDSTTFSAPTHVPRMLWSLAAILRRAGRPGKRQRSSIDLAGSRMRWRLIAVTANNQFDD
ncbi:MAG: hypothetical protein KGL42_11085 [Betaproteobacteria bacterium]|nr:hypothetical protein [Betaproteobacteria bacterium]